MENIFDFEDFINEDKNFERISDTECYLTRSLYYYNEEDDIMYGSDEKPYGKFTIMFENDDNFGLRLIVFELNTGKYEEFDGENEILDKINELGGGISGFEDIGKIQDLFESDDDSRYILLDGKRMLASSFDVIEEN